MSKKFQLSEPVQFGSETIEEIEIRKPRAKELRKLPAKPSTSDMLDFAGELCGLTPKQIDLLSIEDAMELLEIVSDFIPAGRRTGSSA